MIEIPPGNRIVPFFRASSDRVKASWSEPSTEASCAFHPNAGLVLLATLFLANLLDLISRLALTDALSVRGTVLLALQGGACLVLAAVGWLMFLYRGSLAHSPNCSQEDSARKADPV